MSLGWRRRRGGERRGGRGGRGGMSECMWEREGGGGRGEGEGGGGGEGVGSFQRSSTYITSL